MQQQFRITKKIRLIELFAGIGSQAMSLRRLGVDFENWVVCEIDKFAIKSYNAVHGTNFETSNILDLKGKDLHIEETDKYTYILTYSFPCQDLSLVGKQRGMKKESDTRSGLLWQVERLLNECDDLPQILLMENVPQVHGKKNFDDFNSWIKFLESKGYSCFWKDLNAKNYGVPQNRKRCFMISVLGGVKYEFPNEIPLNYTIKDFLETSVDKKFYLSERMIKGFQKHNVNHKQKGTGFIWKPKTGDEIANCLRANASLCATDNTIIQKSDKYNFALNSLSVRKLTPKECWRLMGFLDQDFEKAKAAGISNTQLYKQAGNSIVVNVLMLIFKQML